MNVHPDLRREQDHAKHVVWIVEELAQPARGGEGRGVDVNGDEAEQIVVVEGSGAGALNAREQRFGGRRIALRRGPHRVRRSGGLGEDSGSR